MRRRARKAIGHGLGPFTPDCLMAFSQCRCQKCGRPIPENSLLGNALVVQYESILVLCSACRTGKECILYPEHPFRWLPRSDNANNTIERTVLIGEMDWLIAKGNLSFSGYEFLLCLRHGFAHFQKYGRNPFAGFSATVLQDAERRFGRPLPGNCGECGALWANAWELAQKNRGDRLRERQYSDIRCWACGFPHAGQWFMRTSLTEEKRCLIGGD